MHASEDVNGERRWAIDCLRFILRSFMSPLQAVVQSFSITTYLEATVLLQSYMRRTVAIMEASERRRLRDDQVRREAYYSITHVLSESSISNPRNGMFFQK